jgi:hypothetical protein
MGAYNYDTGDFGADYGEVTQHGYISGRGFSGSGASFGQTFASANLRYGNVGLRRFWRGRPSLTGIDSSFSRSTPTGPGIIEGEGPLKFPHLRRGSSENTPTKDYGPPQEQDISGFASVPRPYPGGGSARPGTQFEKVEKAGIGPRSGYDLTNVQNRPIPGMSTQAWEGGAPSSGTGYSMGFNDPAIGSQPAIGPGTPAIGPYRNAIDTTSSD